MTSCITPDPARAKRAFTSTKLGNWKCVQLQCKLEEQAGEKKGKEIESKRAPCAPTRIINSLCVHIHKSLIHNLHIICRVQKRPDNFWKVIWADAQFLFSFFLISARSDSVRQSSSSSITAQHSRRLKAQIPASPTAACKWTTERQESEAYALFFSLAPTTSCWLQAKWCMKASGKK